MLLTAKNNNPDCWNNNAAFEKCNEKYFSNNRLQFVFFSCFLNVKNNCKIFSENLSCLENISSKSSPSGERKIMDKLRINCFQFPGNVWNTSKYTDTRDQNYKSQQRYFLGKKYFLEKYLLY